MKENTVVIEQKVKEYILSHNMLQQGDDCLIGVSGGADSVCLFMVLLSLAKELGIRIHVLHLNHLLRGSEAERDALMVQTLCEKYHIPFHLYTAHVDMYAKEWGMTLEEAGRKLRYQFLENEAETIERTHSCAVCKIAVAHNKNDVAETVLLNVLRGTGMSGMKGIVPVRGRIIRPLLAVERCEIETYLKEIQQEYCIDSTNLSPVYTRNKIRLNILPEMENVNARAVEHLCNLAKISSQYYDYVDSCVEEWLFQNCIGYDSQDCQDYMICIDMLKKADNLIENLALKKLISLCCGGQKDVGSKHIEEVKKLYNSISGSKIMLPHGAEAVHSYGNLHFFPKTGENNIPALNIAITGDGEYLLPDGNGMLKVSVYERTVNIDLIKKEYTKFLDYDKIRNSIHLRNYMENDYMIIDAKGSKKKMNRIFSSYKIPSEKRPQIPLLASGSEIIWAIGMRIGENYKVDKNTKTIICFEWINKR